MTARARTTTVGVGLLTLLAALCLAVAEPSGSNGAYSELSSSGVALPLAYGRGSVAVDSHIHGQTAHAHGQTSNSIAAARVIAEHRDIAFFVRETPGQAPCYGTGKITSANAVAPGAITCMLPDAKFPSPEQPILFTIGLEMQKPENVATVLSMTGFSADGVSEIVVTDHRGATVGRQRVVRNTFVIPLAGTRRSQLATVTALDRSGNRIYEADMTGSRPS